MDQKQSVTITDGEVSMDGVVTRVTRQDIINFPFPYKLWVLIHLDSCDFLRWNRDGTVVLLDLIALEDYLNSTRSIFKIKNRSVFLEHLEQFQYERLNSTPEVGEDLLLQYKNDNFKRHRLDLVAKIRRHNVTNYCQSTSFCLQAEPVTKKINTAVERMPGDLCFMSHGALSSIQKSRIRFQTILSFQNATRTLQEKLQASDEHAAAQMHQCRNKTDKPTRTKAANSMQQLEEEQIIELPFEMFENPHDSVMHLDRDFRPDYAGYYGNCSKEQIKHFFGDYLPMYEDGSMEVKKTVPEIGSINQYSHTSGVEQGNKEQTVPKEQVVPEEPEQIVPDIDYKVSATTPRFMPQKSMPSLNLSSTLEPIFKENDDDDNQIFGTTLSAKAGDNTDINMEASMEVDQMKMEDTFISSHDFPQMPPAITNETANEENSENEAFSNFFRQYRSSINLLYDRH